MKRKTSTVSSRIWTFWCHRPVLEVDRLDEQFRLARLYKNKRIEIEQERRAKRDAAFSSHPDVAFLKSNIADLDVQLEDKRKKIADIHQEERTRETPSETRAQISNLVKFRESLYDKMKMVRQALAKGSLAEILKKIDEESYAAVKMAYNDSTCFWGTKLLIDKEMEQAQKTPTGPQFRKWYGHGRVGVQIQRGIAIPAMMSQLDTRIKLMKSDPALPQTGKRPLDSVSIRIDSDEKGKPVWTKLPCIIHRELPQQGLVKWAWISRYKVGPRMKYEVSLVLESEEFDQIEKGSVERVNRMCAIDVGWRKREGALMRYAYLWDGKESKEFTLPSHIESHFEKANQLRSIRQKIFNQMRDEIVSWLDEHPQLKPIFPRIAEWRVPARLAKAFFAWKSARLEGDESLYLRVAEWMRRENHLYRWESGARNKTLNCRLEIYRQAARQIASTYSTIVIEEFDLRDVIERKSAEEKEEEMHKEARSQRFQVALSEFKQQLREQARKFGSHIVEVPAENSTLMCHRCFFTEKWDKTPRIMHTCKGCGEAWDQDFNAAYNLYRRGVVTLSKQAMERPSSQEKPAPTQTKEFSNMSGIFDIDERVESP